MCPSLFAAKRNEPYVHCTLYRFQRSPFASTKSGEINERWKSTQSRQNSSTKFQGKPLNSPPSRRYAFPQKRNWMRKTIRIGQMRRPVHECTFPTGDNLVCALSDLLRLPTVTRTARLSKMKCETPEKVFNLSFFFLLINMTYYWIYITLTEIKMFCIRAHPPLS